MSFSEIDYIPNKTTIFFSKVNKIWAVAGLPNLWIHNEQQNKIYKYFHRMLTMCFVIFIIMEIGVHITQSHLTEKQTNDALLFSFSHPILFSYYIALEFHKQKIKKIFVMLCITLKKVHNDPEVEIRMIKKSKFSTIVFAFTVGVTVGSYGIDGLVQAIHSGRGFITVITAWPDIEDNRLIANLARVAAYLAWLNFMIRMTFVITVLIMMTVILSHQYKNLQSYFYSLNDIFKTDADEINHKQNELKYIEALKVGIKSHSDTLWCTKECQETSSFVFSGQIVINIFVQCLLMLQMVNSERTLGNTFTIICTSISLLGSSGFVMWNAGDITFEAALLPTALYSSGWQHCRGTTSSIVRRLLITSMIQAQKHVVLRSFGIVEISYESYLAIVKFSYSAFSLLY